MSYSRVTSRVAKVAQTVQFALLLPIRSLLLK